MLSVINGALTSITSGLTTAAPNHTRGYRRVRNLGIIGRHGRHTRKEGVMDLGLTNKVAIITGGSEGIGKAAAHRMAEEGAKVVIVARRPDVLKAAAEEIQKATKGTVLPVQGDVGEAATVTRVVQTTLDNFGRIDILVNNAGVS